MENFFDTASKSIYICEYNKIKKVYSFNNKNESQSNIITLPIRYIIDKVCFIENKNLVVVTTKSNQLILWDFMIKIEIINSIYNKKITNILVKNDKIICVFIDEIHIYSIDGLILNKFNLQSKIKLIATNYLSHMVIFYIDDNILSYNSISNSIVESDKLYLDENSKYVGMTVDSTGDLIAISSQNYIYLFKNYKLVKTLFRGSNIIFYANMSFSDDGKFLALCSNLPTIHIFDLRENDSIIWKLYNYYNRSDKKFYINEKLCENSNIFFNHDELIIISNDIIYTVCFKKKIITSESYN